MNIRRSADRYEAWLETQLKGELVQKDIVKKHERMCDGQLEFLRATYWRWAERILDADVCGDLTNAPVVLAVGDIHAENFGTWRDLEGRFVWGVNDFDEAAEMPYALDLVRLGASAAFAASGRLTVASIARRILAGYHAGLDDPHPIILDQDELPLRALLEVTEDAREKFWEKFAPSKTKDGGKKTPPTSYIQALEAARPEPTVAFDYRSRTAGAGSLGRPRWAAVGDWRGAPIVREAKAIVPSAWNLVSGRGSLRLRCQEIATGRYRAPDPWYRLTDSVLVRRLSPNNRKLEFSEGDAEWLVTTEILTLMGRDLAAVHLGVKDRAKAIQRDLEDRDEWLAGAIKAAMAFVETDFGIWKENCTAPARKARKKPKAAAKS